jgi:OOP family OmpA-OmpF porin
MNKWVILLVGLLLVWALFEFGARPRAPEIQADIHSRSTAAVTQAGIDGITVTTDGRDVTLSGQAANQDIIDEAGRIVADVRGVRIVHNDILVHAPYVTEFCKNDESIFLSGEVPDSETIAEFPERARDMYRYWTVEEDLNVRTDSADGFRHFMDEALIELGQLDEGCVTLTDQSLLVAGKIRSERAAADLKDRLAELSKMHFDISYDLELPVLSEQARACQTQANKRISRDESVLFSFDSAVIHEVGRQLLDEVVEISKLCPDVAILVQGHTDSVGDRDYNVALGERRAEAVVKYLIENGMSAERLTPVSMGFSQPVADNSTEKGRAANRRIEFRAREE